MGDRCLPLLSSICLCTVTCLSHAIFFWSQLCLLLFSSSCPSSGFLGPGGVLESTLSPFVFVCLSPSCRLLGPGDVLRESALSPLVFCYLSPSCHLLGLSDFLRVQLSQPLFPSTCRSAFSFVSLCFVYLSPSCRLLGPGDVLGKSALSPLVFFHLSPSCHLLGLGDFLKGQLFLLLFSSTCLLPVACLGSVIFLGVNFICLCFLLLVKSSSFVSLYLPVSCHLLGPHDFLAGQLCLPFFSSTCAIVFLCAPLLVSFLPLAWAT